jgi:hypothetical protein
VLDLLILYENEFKLFTICYIKYLKPIRAANIMVLVVAEGLKVSPCFYVGGPWELDLRVSVV